MGFQIGALRAAALLLLVTFAALSPTVASAYVVLDPNLSSVVVRYDEIRGGGGGATMQAVHPTGVSLSQPQGGASAAGSAGGISTGAQTSANSAALHPGLYGHWQGWNSSAAAILSIPGLKLVGNCTRASAAPPGGGFQLPLCEQVGEPVNPSDRIADPTKILTRLRLHLDGTLRNFFTALPGGTSNGHAQATSQVHTRLEAVVRDAGGQRHTVGSSTGYYTLENRFALNVPQDNYEYEQALGMFNGTSWSKGSGTRSFDGTLLTEPMYVPLLAVFELQFSITTSSSAIVLASDAWAANSDVDFLNTFGLPMNEPIFDLPAGVTFDAPSLGIVNNCIGACISTVSEPHPLALLGTGALALAALRRVNRRAVAQSRPLT